MGKQDLPLMSYLCPQCTVIGWRLGNYWGGGGTQSCKTHSTAYNKYMVCAVHKPRKSKQIFGINQFQFLAQSEAHCP